MPESKKNSLEDLRNQYHGNLQATIWGYHGSTGHASNADKGSLMSVKLAKEMLAGAEVPTTNPPSGQAVGSKFAELTKDFIQASFQRLQHIRPGNWVYSIAQTQAGITAYDQYAHLATVQRILEEHKEDKQFRSAFAQDYLIVPDIVIGRARLADSEINQQESLIEPSSTLAANTPLRAANVGDQLIMHASISCKWTIRSDRAQNTRTEALNLIRNRKGNAPHIVAVTAEPLPTRLASLALGTGDLDCVYHMGLLELERALHTVGDESQLEMFEILVSGRRLRGISDLPFDLAV